MKTTNRKHIVITGSRGSGKTTLINKLVSKKTGFTTVALPGDKVVLQFDGVTSENNSYIIGRYTPGEGSNRMQPDIDNLNTLATFIENISSADVDSYFTIDEIGYLEESSPAFCKAITGLFDKFSVIATVRKQDTVLRASILSRDDILLIDLDNPFGNCGCVVMASGLGLRFGQNKLMTKLLDSPLISYILSTTQALFDKSVVVTRHTSVQDYCNSIGQYVILHALPHRNDTARLGTEYMMSQAVDSILFFQGDQPLVSIDSIMSILICAKNCPGKIIRLSYQGSDYSPVLFPSYFYEQLTKLPESKGGNYLAQTHADSVIRVEANSELEIIDIDTPEDIETILPAITQSLQASPAET